MKIEEPLWTSSEVFNVCEVTSLMPWFSDGLQTDSRDVLPGDLFVALKGAYEDGHDYVADAFERGAPAAIVFHQPKGVAEGDPRLVMVPDVLKVLEGMAAYAQLRAPVSTIAVTGSAGKTSIVQALRKSLSRNGETHASIKSFNNHIGLPLSMARMPRSTRYGIFEIGISQPGEMVDRARVISPDVVIISTIGAAHIANFSSMDEIVAEKAKIFEGMKPGSKAVIGIDNIYADRLIALAKKNALDVITVSAEKEADVTPKQATTRYNCTCLTADILGTMITYKIGQPGQEWILNSLLVLTAIKAINADMGMAALALASLEAEEGRGRVHALTFGDHKFTLIDDSYNANPVSMHAALERLSLMPVASGARRLGVFADMAELGSLADEAHEALAGKMLASGLYKVFALGDKMANAAQTAGLAVEKFSDVGDLADAVIEEIGNGDSVLVKGSNNARLGCVVDSILDRASVSPDFDRSNISLSRIAE